MDGWMEEGWMDGWMARVAVSLVSMFTHHPLTQVRVCALVYSQPGGLECRSDRFPC